MGVCVGEAEHVQEVFVSEGEDGGREEHDLVVGMGYKEEDVVLARFGVEFLVGIDKDEGEKVQCNQDVFEVGIDNFQECVHE
ncbi:unnamed protein product [Sphagnum balticum]